MKIRCSAISEIIGGVRNKESALTETAKSYLIAKAKEDLFGFKKFTGSKYTEKGNEIEETAITASGMIRGKTYRKNQIRLENDWITGECDIHDAKARKIIDVKCTWDIGTHPFFAEEAEKKAKAAGYDYQVQGYMWLFDCDRADIDFWLFPCPEEQLGKYDDPETLITLVENIPLQKRVTTVSVQRDDAIIERIKKKVEVCRAFYDSLIRQVA